MKMSKFTDIGQFRNVIKNVIQSSQFKGLDDSGEPIFDYNIKPPIVSFTGTVKLHGSNGAIGIDKDNNVWFQSRSQIITQEKDNAGFAFFANARKDIFIDFAQRISYIPGHVDNESIIIFGEWCGKGIQKGVAINKLDKMFVIFAVKVIEPGGENYYLHQDYWKDIKSPEHRIFNIYDYKTFEMDIDFDNPSEAQNKIAEWVNEVERECPVGKAFGVSGVGEGIVWTGFYKDARYIFKTKGEKHSISKTKTIAPVDVEKVKSINGFVDYAVTENRLNQAMEQVFTANSIEPSKRYTGDFLKWLTSDIAKEETDVLVKNNLEPKDVNKYISVKGRKWFFSKLDEQVGL